jgi:hypothetical protein
MPKSTPSTASALLACAFLCAGACSDDPPAPVYPYEPGQTRVIGVGGADSGAASGQGGAPVSSAAVGRAGVGEFDTPQGDDCLEFLDGCARPQDECGADGTADVILGERGEVLSVICYPNRNYEVVELADQVEDPVLGNRQVIVLDGEDDGDDVIGDLTVVGNNVIVYGEGPDSSVIGGNLAIDKNNAIVRGVRIRGDTTITKNNASLIFCAIEGNLTISGNNVNLALCDIFGDVTISGNNAVFVSNRVAGDQAVEGVNLRCNDNWRFVDADGDARVSEGELGERIECRSRDSAVGDDPNLDTRTSP